jgi:hypothetical protein
MNLLFQYFYSDEGDRKFFLDLNAFLPNYTASYPRNFDLYIVNDTGNKTVKSFNLFVSMNCNDILTLICVLQQCV